MEISFFSLIGQASPLAKAVLALLLLMSVSSWALMLRKWLALRAGMAKTLEGVSTGRAICARPCSLSAAIPTRPCTRWRTRA